MGQRTEILTKLKADLLDVRDSKEERMNQLRTRYETRMKEHQEVFDGKREKLEKEINVLRESNKKLRNASHEEEVGKKKTSKRLEIDVENAIRQYDTVVKGMAYELN